MNIRTALDWIEKSDLPLQALSFFVSLIGFFYLAHSSMVALTVILLTFLLSFAVYRLFAGKALELRGRTTLPASREVVGVVVGLLLSFVVSRVGIGMLLSFALLAVLRLI